MKQMKNLFRILMIAIIFLGPSGCTMIAGQLAMAGGKKVYQKMQDDKAEKEQTEQ